MTHVESTNGTASGAVNGLIGYLGETLGSMGLCPKKTRLERIYDGLRWEQAALETALRGCDVMAERKALYRLMKKIARFYRMLDADGREQ